MLAVVLDVLQVMVAQVAAVPNRDKLVPLLTVC
jgi:hypothetical protein